MNTSKKSIITDDLSTCYICGRPATEIHHCIFGTANRKLSDKYGMIVGLCYDHHRGKHGVHNGNRELDLKLKRLAQEQFNKTYEKVDFIAIFGRNYL